MGDAYDVAVIGAGTGGYSAALRAAQLGKRVAIVERDERLGGTCLLRGCIPTKALLQSAAVMDTVNRASEWGIKASGEPDWSAREGVRGRVVDKLVKGVTGLSRRARSTWCTGRPGCVPVPRVEVDGRAVDAGDVIIATGSAPKLLPGHRDRPTVITSDQALWADRIPSSAVVIGAGAVGLEFASIYRSFGAEVTLIEALPRARAARGRGDLEGDRAGVPQARHLDRRRRVGAARSRTRATRVEVTYDAGGRPRPCRADVCLVAIGRGPVTEGLGLEEAGVSLHEKGFVQRRRSAADQRRARVGGRRRRGDAAAARPRLVHRGVRGRRAHRRASTSPEIDYVNIPRVTYCTPEIASVGLTEAQAVERGHRGRHARSSTSARSARRTSSARAAS